MGFDCRKGFIAEVMLELAGVLCGGLLVHAQKHQKLCKGGVAIVYLFGNLFSAVCKGDISVFVHVDKSAAFQKTDCAADAGL